MKHVKSLAKLIEPFSGRMVSIQHHCLKTQEHIDFFKKVNAFLFF